MTRLIRETGETTVELALSTSVQAVQRPGRGSPEITTGKPFLDHMLITLARYAGFELEVSATGDLRHHLVEDVAITLGLVLAESVPTSCRRYAEATVPMDDALVQVVLDLGGRSYYEGPLPSKLYDHFMRSFAENARLNLHIRTLRGHDRHHIIEATFKALGLALAAAVQPGEVVFSTKGPIRLDWGHE